MMRGVVNDSGCAMINLNLLPKNILFRTDYSVLLKEFTAC